MSETIEIPKTMLAATVVAYNEPLQLRGDVKVPDVPDDRILVKIKASSLCSTDLAGYMGYVPHLTQLPYCAGHEPVGEVVKLGSAVRGFEIGDRVGFMMFTDVCGTCSECFTGQHRYCEHKKVQGFADAHGGFSEYSLADPISTVKLPEGLSYEIAAPLFCAGITAYSAVLKAKSRPGGLVNIIGCGGVGHVAIMYAKAMGFRVHAYDIAEDKLKLAERSGADKVFNSKTADPATFEPALSTIVITGANAAYDSAVNLTANHGAIIAVGLPAGNLQISVPIWSAKDLTFIPCNTGSRTELAEALELAVRHNIKPAIEVRSIDTINQGYQDLAQGKIEGRIVYKF